MNLVIVICLVLTVKSHAESYTDSSEENNRYSSFYNVLKYMGMDSASQWQSPASALPGAVPYKIKVTQRLQNSSFLSTMPDLQDKLYKLADEKLEQCVTPMGLGLDRHCVGRVSGQMMQIISAVENSNRYSAYNGDRRREETRY